jgi:hypothetical protein
MHARRTGLANRAYSQYVRRVAVVIVVIACFGCSGSKQASSPEPPPTGVARSTPSTTEPRVSTQATLAQTHSVPTTALVQNTRAARRCHTSQLLARPGEGGVGLGNVMTVLTLTNVSDVPCRLYGYPGIQMLDSNHRAIPTHVARGDTYFRLDPGPTRVFVGPNETASFVAAWGHVPPGPELCAASTYVRLTPPDETDYLTIPVAIDACAGGIFVTAIVAGANGPPQ